MIRVVLYARVSSEEQRDGKNIDSQVEELKSFIASKEKEGWILAGEYKDNGWSGTTLARPELDRLRDDALMGKFDTVVVNDIDRMARDNTDLGLIKKDLIKKGIRLLFRKLPESQGVALDNLMVNVLGSFAEFEKTVIMDRLRRGRLHKARANKLVGNVPPYGYKYIRIDKERGVEGHYEISHEEAGIVKKIFYMVAYEEKTARNVARELTRLGIPAPKGGARWGRSTILRILRNKAYIGIAYYNRYESFESLKPRNTQRYKKRLKSATRIRPESDWIKIPVPRIIDDETFNIAQKAIENNRMFSPRNGKRQYLLRGLVKCEQCGSLYHGTPCHGKTFYRCSNRDKMFPNPRQCKARMISTHILEDAVWLSICSAVQNPKLIMEQVERLHKNRFDKKQIAENELDEIEKEVARLKSESARLLVLYKKQIFDEQQVEEENRKVRGEIAIQEEKRQRYLSQTNNVLQKDAIKSVGHYLSLVKGRLETFSFEEKQKFLRYLVRGIIFDGAKAVVKAEIPLYKPQERSLIESGNVLIGEGQIENTSNYLRVLPEAGKQCLLAHLHLFSHQ